MDVVRAEGVTKRFSARSILKDLDLDLRAGEVMSVTGPNGTGKSTLLRLIAGSYLPDEGEVRLMGDLTSTATARKHVATSYNDDRSWYGRLSCWENLRFWLSLKGSWPGQAAELLEALGLTPLRDRPVNVLSSGQRARLGIVRAMAAQTPLLLLDEPTRGVDTGAGKVVADAITAAASAGRTVMIATHDDLLRERIGGGRLELGFVESM